MARYTDEARANAVALLAAAGYPDRTGALSEISRQLNIPSRTLSRWFKREQNPPPDKLVTEKKGELSDLYEDAAHKFLQHSVDNYLLMKPKEAITAAAIATDKMQLLRGLPTEIIELSPEIMQLLDLIRAMGQDPKTALTVLIRKLEAQHDPD